MNWISLKVVAITSLLVQYLYRVSGNKQDSPDSYSNSLKLLFSTHQSRIHIWLELVRRTVLSGTWEINEEIDWIGLFRACRSAFLSWCAKVLILYLHHFNNHLVYLHLLFQFIIIILYHAVEIIQAPKSSHTSGITPQLLQSVSVLSMHLLFSTTSTIQS